MEKDQHARILEIARTIRNVPEETWDSAPESGTWTRKQILGHLADSAANNLQRFVRIQFEENPIIYYNQDQWVSTIHYAQYDIANLIDLWLALNLHLVHIITHMPSTVKQRTGTGADGIPQTLAWYITDYFHHLEHHLSQIESH